MTLRVATATNLGDPVGGLVTLAQAKAHLHVDGTDDDTLIGSLIGVATELVESHVQRRYLTQSLEWVLPGWPALFELPVAGSPAGPPVVSDIAYVDLAGAPQTWSSSDWVASPRGETARIRPKLGVALPILGPDAEEAVVVAFDVGGSLAQVPAAARHAALLAVADLYAQRETAGLSINIQDVLASERWD